ncbi:MAG: ATP-binding protein [Candidatus Symbiothrix sp.]|jgi:predicted AAA+ superfamily ATPase|nr:ATP-binding protein [Candidatus Symbiothrix sp.]
MQRKITVELIAWKNRKDRMPLILNGASQIGKTYSIKEFGEKEFVNMVYINLERNEPIREIFDGNISPKSLIPALETNTGIRIKAGETLIFLDEIQACERALTSLKYFCEDAPEYHVVAASSLLGVAVAMKHREKFSFPVGKVNEMYLYPLDFEEFIWAMGREKLAEEIRSHYETNEAMHPAFHKMALDYLKKYLVIGGMPAAVKSFVDSESYIESANAQTDIYNEYIADTAKYADPATGIKIRACYDSIPAQLAKENHKFQYKMVQKGGTATIFGISLEWLKFAGIVLKCQKITQGEIPIAVYQYFPDFKLYMGDVGMLTLKSQIPVQMLLAENNEANTFLGSFTENYVAQAFTANKKPLFYWTNDNQGEVDFVLQEDVNVVPVEVKRGINTRSRSLTMFMKKYNCPYAIRISQKNFGFENHIKSVPLYAVFCI